MFARVAAFSAVALFATSVAATPAAMAAGSCNTGPIQCCNQVQSANSGGIITAILNLLNVVVDANAQIGFDCSPINVIGVGQSQCSASPVCCDNNNVGGLISIGCLPVKL
ncbi:hypothetical protein NLI96_g11393 [Meripilus lineatus]|uniref:Hydrophobin n=1 Tax=Meripilus lineatus TaxID=2056292 RepID=A0AAD5URY0_9APHY|nr:hypothetical protein NLI96_g11393 [Physisporinus lineatus]